MDKRKTGLSVRDMGELGAHGRPLSSNWNVPRASLPLS